MPAAPVILLTRPQEASERFADQMRGALGDVGQVLIAPLMRVDFTGRLPEMTDIRGLIFTSANGVRGYAAAGGRRDLPGFAVGDATGQAARRERLQVQVAGGDAQSLLRHLAKIRPAAPLLHVRGEHARGDVAARLCRLGLETREVVLYRQILLPPSDAARRALRGRAPVVVPLFSPRTAAQFAAQHGGRAPLYIAAMSEAVADKVAHLPVQRLLVAERPDAPAMLCALSTLLDRAARLEGAQGEG